MNKVKVIHVSPSQVSYSWSATDSKISSISSLVKTKTTVLLNSGLCYLVQNVFR